MLIIVWLGLLTESSVGTVVGTSNLAGQNTAIAFICIYIFFFACSWGPCAWVVTG